jgi:hypothetical protein
MKLTELQADTPQPISTAEAGVTQPHVGLLEFLESKWQRSSATTNESMSRLWSADYSAESAKAQGDPLDGVLFDTAKLFLWDTPKDYAISVGAGVESLDNP